MKNIQMPERFVVAVYALLHGLENYDLDEQEQTLCREIEGYINTKLEAMKRRQVFSEYKTAAVESDERETKRREYLDKTGIHKSWRTEKESHL